MRVLDQLGVSVEEHVEWRAGFAILKGTAWRLRCNRGSFQCPPPPVSKFHLL